MNKRINGFTIADLLAAMIISGILIAGAYSAYLSFHRQLRVISDTSSQTSSLYTLYTLTDDYFWDSDSVIYQCCDTLSFFSKDTVSAKICSAPQGILLFFNNAIDTFPLEKTSINARPYTPTPETTFRVKSASIRGSIGKEDIMLWVGK